MYRMNLSVSWWRFDAGGGGGMLSRDSSNVQYGVEAVTVVGVLTLFEEEVTRCFFSLGPFGVPLLFLARVRHSASHPEVTKVQEGYQGQTSYSSSFEGRQILPFFFFFM